MSDPSKLSVRVKMAHAYPLEFVTDNDGKACLKPGHPTRLARSTDSSTWVEEVPVGVAPGINGTRLVSVSPEPVGRKVA